MQRAPATPRTPDILEPGGRTERLSEDDPESTEDTP